MSMDTGMYKQAITMIHYHSYSSYNDINIYGCMYVQTINSRGVQKYRIGSNRRFYGGRFIIDP